MNVIQDHHGLLCVPSYDRKTVQRQWSVITKMSDTGSLWPSYFYWPFQGGPSVVSLCHPSRFSYVALVLSLFVSYLFFFWCLGKAVLRNCGISLVSFLISFNFQGPVVQSIVSLTSSLVVKMLTVLVSAISNPQVFLLKKMWVAFSSAKATNIFSAKILAYRSYLKIKVLTIC